MPCTSQKRPADQWVGAGVRERVKEKKQGSRKAVEQNVLNPLDSIKFLIGIIQSTLPLDFLKSHFIIIEI